jgi:hypothetical protein
VTGRLFQSFNQRIKGSAGTAIWGYVFGGSTRGDPDVWIGLDHVRFGMDRAVHFDSLPLMHQRFYSWLHNENVKGQDSLSGFDFRSVLLISLDMQTNAWQNGHSYPNMYSTGSVLVSAHQVMSRSGLTKSQSE